MLLSILSIWFFCRYFQEITSLANAEVFLIDAENLRVDRTSSAGSENAFKRGSVFRFTEGCLVRSCASLSLAYEVKIGTNVSGDVRFLRERLSDNSRGRLKIGRGNGEAKRESAGYVSGCIAERAAPKRLPG